MSRILRYSQNLEALLSMSRSTVTLPSSEWLPKLEDILCIPKMSIQIKKCRISVGL